MNVKRMFRKFKQARFSLLAIGLATAAIGIGVGLSHAAGAAKLTLSPASGSHDINTSFSVTVFENSSDAVGAVEADFSYDAAKLQFVSLDVSASAFDTQYPSSGGSGKVKIARASSSGPLTGSHNVATVNFKVLAGSGSTALSFLSSSALVRSSDNANVWDGTTTGGSYTLTTPPTVCPAGQTGTPPNCTTPPSTCPSGQTGTPPNCTTPGGTSTTTTTTNDHSNSSSSNATIAEQQANPEAPVPVNNNAPSNNGYFVAIKVTDAKSQPVKDADVTLSKQTVKSDATGIASFVNVPAGTYTAKIHSVLGNSTVKVTVNANADPAAVQQFDTKLKPKTPVLLYLVFGILVLVAIGLAVFHKLKGRWPWDMGHKGDLPPPTPLDTTVLSPNNSTEATPISIDEHLNNIQVTPPTPETTIEPNPPPPDIK